MANNVTRTEQTTTGEDVSAGTTQTTTTTTETTPVAPVVQPVVVTQPQAVPQSVNVNVTPGSEGGGSTVAINTPGVATTTTTAPPANVNVNEG